MCTCIHVCIYMFACMHICIYVCIYMYVYICRVSRSLKVSLDLTDDAPVAASAPMVPERAMPDGTYMYISIYKKEAKGILGCWWKPDKK